MRVAKEQNMMAPIGFEVWQQSATRRVAVAQGGVRRTEEFKTDELPHGDGWCAGSARLDGEVFLVEDPVGRADAHDQTRSTACGDSESFGAGGDR